MLLVCFSRQRCVSILWVRATGKDYVPPAADAADAADAVDAVGADTEGTFFFFRVPS